MVWTKMAKIISKLKQFTPFIILILIAIFIYIQKLNFSPVHLNQDELEFSLNGYSISNSLKDLSGRFMPFYFWHLGSFWATPIITYLEALFLFIFPLSEVSIRLPSVFIGISIIILMMILVHKIFKNKLLSLISGLLVFLTPVVFIHSRLLLDNLYIVPFVILWLIFLKDYFDKQKLIYLFLSGLFLGVGIHSYHAAKVYMPIYFFITVFFLFLKKEKIIKNILAFILGFSIPIILFIPWLIKYPDTLTNQINYVSSIDKTIDSNIVFGGILRTKRIEQMANSYLSYFSPNILVVSGDRSFIHSTKTTGAFIFPFIFLFMFGLLEIFFKEKDIFSKIFILGFLTYPIAPSLIDDPSRISRALIVIVFFIIICTYGVKYLFSSKEKYYKFLLWTLLIFSVFQFNSFLKNYFSNYRKESYHYFNFNIGGVFEAALNSTKNRNVNKIFIDSEIPFSNKYWQFYQIKNNIYIDPQKVEYAEINSNNLEYFPINSLVIVYSRKIRERKDWIGKFEKIETLREPDGVESFYLYFRDK